MAFKDNFSAEEWKTLQLSVIWVFHAIAEVDGLVDEKEWSALFRTFNEDTNITGNPLVRDVLESVKVEGNQVLLDTFRKDPRSISMGLKEVAELVEQKLDAPQARSFKQALLFLGVLFARASGEIPGLSSGPKVSEMERAAILTVAAIFRLNQDDLNI